MSAFRTSLVLVFVLVGVDQIVSKPFLEPLLCDLFCTDDDGSTSTMASSDMNFMDDFCEECTPASSKPNAATPGPFNLVIPPSLLGFNLTLINKDNNWQFNIVPSGVTARAPTAAPAAATTAAPAGSTAAPAGSTAAPAGSTAAPAGSTTAAASTAAG